LELLMLIDAAKRASAAKIVVVIPYFGYSRMDKQPGGMVEGRASIAAALVANMICSAGANHAVVMDMHSSQAQGFFQIPVDHFSANDVFVDYLRDVNSVHLAAGRMTIVATSKGSATRTKYMAEQLECGFAVIDSRENEAASVRIRRDSKVKTPAAEKLESSSAPPPKASTPTPFWQDYFLIGDVTDKTCVLVDDIIDSAVRLQMGIRMLREKGATSVTVAAPHVLPQGKGLKTILDMGVKIVSTNSIENTMEELEQGHTGKVHILNIADIIASNLQRVFFA